MKEMLAASSHITKFLASVVAEEEMDKSSNNCGIIVELGESFLIKIISSPPSQPHV